MLNLYQMLDFRLTELLQWINNKTYCVNTYSKVNITLSIILGLYPDVLLCVYYADAFRTAELFKFLLEPIFRGWQLFHIIWSNEYFKSLYQFWVSPY